MHYAQNTKAHKAMYLGMHASFSHPQAEIWAKGWKLKVPRLEEVVRCNPKQTGVKKKKRESVRLGTQLQSPASSRFHSINQLRH